MSTYYGKRFLIKSADRVSYLSTSPSNFQLNFTECLRGSFKVIWITIPNTIYNLPLGKNRIRANATDFDLTPGSYSSTELGLELSRALNAIQPGSAPWGVTVSGVTSKFVLASGGSQSVVFEPATANESLGLLPAGEFVADLGSPSKTIFLGVPLSLGIKIRECADVGYLTAGGSYQNTPEGTTVEGKTVSTQAFFPTHRESTLIVPLVAESKSFNYVDHHSNPQQFYLEQETRNLRIRVVDTETDTEVDLNNCAWEMLVQCTCIEPGKKKRFRESEYGILDKYDY